MTQAEAEAELKRLRALPWIVISTSGKRYGVESVALADLAALCDRVGNELVVDAGKVSGPRYDGTFSVVVPSIEIYDSYRD